MSIHANSANDEVHTPIRFLYANSTARLAATFSSFTALDAGKFAWQLDDNSVWLLASIGSGSSDPIWIQVSTPIGSIVKSASIALNRGSSLSTTSNSYSSTGLTLSFAMTNPANKLRMRVTGGHAQNNTATPMYTSITKDGTDLVPSGQDCLECNMPTSGNGFQSSHRIEFEHSPGDISSHSYDVVFKNIDNSSQVVWVAWNQAAVPALFVIEEIKQ